MTKEEFRELAKLTHPDTNPGVEPRLFIAVKRLFDKSVGVKTDGDTDISFPDGIPFLMDDLLGKKEFISKWNTSCDVGDEDIKKGDKFCFYGDKQKVCMVCLKKTFIMLKSLL